MRWPHYFLDKSSLVRDEGEGAEVPCWQGAGIVVEGTGWINIVAVKRRPTAKARGSGGNRLAMAEGIDALHLN